MPLTIAALFNLRNSLAFRKAVVTVASGLSFVPGFVSDPFGATYISAALPDRAISTKNANRQFGNRFIYLLLTLLNVLN